MVEMFLLLLLSVGPQERRENYRGKGFDCSTPQAAFGQGIDSMSGYLLSPGH